MSKWTWAWIGWGIYFALVEGFALANSRTGDTLSEHVWAFLGLRTKLLQGKVIDEEVEILPRIPTTWTKIRRVIIMSFMLWLSVHFLTGGEYV